jgi:hypothetical protein
LGGRSPGSRNKLSHRFLTDLLENWERNGAQAIELFRKQDPGGYVRTVASLLPRELSIENTTVKDVDDDVLDLMIEEFQRQLDQLEKPMALIESKPPKVTNGRPEESK